VLCGWHLAGCHVNLPVGQEAVLLDTWDGIPLTWAGPAVAPSAVAPLYTLYEPAVEGVPDALIDARLSAEDGFGPATVASAPTPI
jgi:hypothetical protein